MSIQIKQASAMVNAESLDNIGHLVFILPSNKPANFIFSDVLEARLKRAQFKYADLAKSSLSADLANGAMATWLVLDDKQSAFQRQTALRKAMKALLAENPQHVALVLLGEESQRQIWASDAIYVLTLKAAELPKRKGEQPKTVQKTRKLKTICVFGCKDEVGFASELHVAAGNTLARSLTMLPPNELTPAHYRKKIAALAESQGWKHEEFDMPALKKMGAGAFYAVAQGSQPQDAAIVHLSYTPKDAKKHIALVGKGICFDTGGHNLKSARYMNGMHEDMNGSAVALGVLHTITALKLPIKVDCWLAIAQNHIGPNAYKQNDVITALNGKTIEIVHTDAEGRMVLADTLTLASRARPDLMLDYATLTGSMVTALGDRYSGVLGNSPEMLCRAVGAGAACGERVNAFPFDEDYDEELESDMADIKQCTLDSEADHILAARFLSQFIEHEVPWLHVDLSAVRRKGGLGAVASDVTGFGVAFTIEFLKREMASKA